MVGPIISQENISQIPNQDESSHNSLGLMVHVHAFFSLLQSLTHYSVVVIISVNSLPLLESVHACIKGIIMHQNSIVLNIYKVEETS